MTIQKPDEFGKRIQKYLKLDMESRPKIAKEPQIKEIYKPTTDIF